MVELLAHFRVLTWILKTGVKCCLPKKVGVFLYFSIETFQKVGVTYSKFGVNENSDFAVHSSLQNMLQ